MVGRRPQHNLPQFETGLAPAGTHLIEGREAFCTRVQTTVPLLGIQGELPWGGKSVHGRWCRGLGACVGSGR